MSANQKWQITAISARKIIKGLSLCLKSATVKQFRMVQYSQKNWEKQLNWKTNRIMCLQLISKISWAPDSTTQIIPRFKIDHRSQKLTHTTWQHPTVHWSKSKEKQILRLWELLMEVELQSNTINHSRRCPNLKRGSNYQISLMKLKWRKQFLIRSH